jgi:hypothetical protein
LAYVLGGHHHGHSHDEEDSHTHNEQASHSLNNHANNEQTSSETGLHKVKELWEKKMMLLGLNQTDNNRKLTSI